MAAVSIPASSLNHAQSPSASASAIVTPHVSISTLPPPQNSRIYSTSNGDPSSRRLRAPSAAKRPPSQSYLSSSKVRVEDMAPQGRSAAVEGYEAERSGMVAGPSTPSSSPPSMSPSTSLPHVHIHGSLLEGLGPSQALLPGVPAHLPSQPTTTRPICFCTRKSIRTRCPWHDALLHHLALTISNNDAITAYRKKKCQPPRWIFVSG